MVDYARGATQALAGAATGATLGSVVPVIGTGVGAAGGAIVGGLSGLFGGGDQDRFDRESTLSPEQEQIFTLVQQLLQGQLGGQGQEAFEAPYLRQFQEQTIPGLAERFSGLGAGAQSSSAFQQSLGAAGAGLQENLASIGATRQQNTITQLMNLLGIETKARTPKDKSFLEQFALGAAPSLVGALGSLGSLGKSKSEPDPTGSFSSIQPGSYGDVFYKK